MSDNVRVVALAEGGNPQTDAAITREGIAWVIEPYSEDGDANYKFRLDVELVNESSRPIPTRIIVEWQDEDYSPYRTYLLVCPGVDEWKRYDARPNGTRISRVIPVPPGRSRLALHPPYDYDRLVRHLGTLPKERMTVRSIGKSLHNRDIFAVEAGQTAVRPIVVMTRVHPYETIASYFAEGMLNWLVQGGAEAERLLAERRVILIPMPNPDGVVEGTCKRTLGGINFSQHIGDSDEPEATAVKDYLVKQNATALFDIHGWMNDWHDYVTNDEARGRAMYEQLMKRPDLFDREIQVIPNPLPKVGGENHLGGYLKGKLGITFFVGSWSWYDRTAAQLKEMGVEILRAYAEQF